MCCSQSCIVRPLCCSPPLYLASPQWIMSPVQARKLEMTEAHDSLVQCVSGSRYTKDLKAYDEEMEKLAVQKAVLEASRLLGGA